MADRLCDYDSCQIVNSPTSGGVTINYHNEERPSFCGACHAAMWLLKREGHKFVAGRVEQILSDTNA